MSGTNEYQALKRIISVLLGLARIAECASQRAFPIRLLVLWLLRPAEPHARNLVIKVARELGYQALLPPSFADLAAPSLFCLAGNTPTDALRLAMTFEMLAAILSDLVELASRQRRPLNPERRSLWLSRMKSAIIPLDGQGRAECGAGWSDRNQFRLIAPSVFARAPPLSGRSVPALS